MNTGPQESGASSMQVVSRLPSETAPARIRPLAVLPVFLDLAGKRAIVAGGSEGAAWKAELLAAAGARVEIFASTPDLSDEMRRIVGRESAVVLRERKWRPADLTGAAVALADAGDEAEAAAFEAAARTIAPLIVIPHTKGSLGRKPLSRNRRLPAPIS